MSSSSRSVGRSTTASTLGRAEPRKNFNLWSLCGVGLMTGCTWPRLGGSIVVALYNGGAPGVIFELIAVSVFYCMISLCIAELASAIPSSAGVYHWAAVAAGPKYGRVASWYAGWFNALGWTFGAASISSMLSNQILSMHQLFNPEYQLLRWHSYLVYLCFTWLSCVPVLFANHALPHIAHIGTCLIFIGFSVILITCIFLPREGGSHAPHQFVWRNWVNLTGYESDGFVFLAGMLNGAYAVGTPDCVAHLAEEIPKPKKNIPKAIGIQMAIGFASALAFLVAIFYSVDDPERLFHSTAIFPLQEVFLQVTGTKGGTMGLLLAMVIPEIFTNIGSYLTCSRIVWTLARDDAIPLSRYLGKLHSRRENPFNAILACGILNTLTGLLHLASSTAFEAFVGSFVILTTLSFLCAIFPYLMTGRKHIFPGWFRMPRHVFVPAAALSSLYIVSFSVIFSFPASLPVSPQGMTFTGIIVACVGLFVTLYWMLGGNARYAGPEPQLLYKLQGLEVLAAHPRRNESSTLDKPSERA